MKHAREDYNRIQDPEGKIPEDEPVFLIRAQDLAGPAAVNAYALMAELTGATDKVVDNSREQALAMLIWQAEHLDDVHPADIPS